MANLCYEVRRPQRAFQPLAVFLEGQNFDSETTRIMGVAYEMVHAALERHWGDLHNELIAKKVIELAKAGETNPDRLCEQVLVYFGRQRFP